jgi:hypothetical protein
MGINGIIVHLLDILIKSLLCIIQLKLLVLTLYLSITDVVSCLETVEDRYAETQAYIWLESILYLSTEAS